MPDNRRPGMLEDFLAFLIPAGDELLPRVDGFLEGFQARRFQDVHLSKARIHCWLASRRRPEDRSEPQSRRICSRRMQDAQPFAQWLRKALVD